mgnify:CR=1 FL=1
MSTTENTPADQTFQTALGGFPITDLYTMRDTLSKAILPNIDPKNVDYTSQVTACATLIQFVQEEIDKRRTLNKPHPDQGPTIVPGSQKILINGEYVDATDASVQARVREVRDEQTS